MNNTVLDAVLGDKPRGKKKRKKVPSSKARGMEHYRGFGYLVGNTETTVPGGFKSDLFGLFDFVGLIDGVTMGVQACLTTDLEAHKAKMAGNKNLPKVLDAWLVRLICFWPWKDEEHRGEYREFNVARGEAGIEFLEITPK